MGIIEPGSFNQGFKFKIENLICESDSTMDLKMISYGVSITHPFAALVNSIDHIILS